MGDLGDGVRGATDRLRESERISDRGGGGDACQSSTTLGREMLAHRCMALSSTQHVICRRAGGARTIDRPRSSRHAMHQCDTEGSNELNNPDKVVSCLAASGHWNGAV
jgi:hypothetical protein